jgi:hypothetical protein
LDSASLGNCLLRIIVHGEEADILLDKYAKVRRTAWVNYTNKASINFKLRLHSTDPEIVAQRDEFMHALNSDPGIHLKMASIMNDAIEDMFEVPAVSDAAPAPPSVESQKEVEQMPGHAR